MFRDEKLRESGEWRLLERQDKFSPGQKKVLIGLNLFRPPSLVLFPSLSVVFSNYLQKLELERPESVHLNVLMVFCGPSILSDEVERLLREYSANQELVRSIGAQYYQFVNVAQIRHHQLIGLSTREGTSKGPRAQAQVMNAPQQARVSPLLIYSVKMSYSQSKPN